MSVQASLCLLRIEIVKSDNEDSKTVLYNEAAAGSVSMARVLKEQRGQRRPRTISIETYSNRLSTESESSGVLPKSSRENTPQDEVFQPPQLDGVGEINFFSGNPFVEVTKGILHFYKSNDRMELREGISTSLCLLAVPTSLSCHDILKFVSPCHAVLQHVRIIRDGSPNQYMVYLEFRSTEAAFEFYKTFNGAPYNSLEPDSLCHAVWVSGIDWGHDGSPPPGHTELPTCPVCLERMDESVDGVLTILCNHAFHTGCLIKWGDSTCPVCRYVQTPEMTEDNVCMECEGTEGLWICLICGHVGCGRYQGGHAASHYRATNHTFALQLGTNRVWDYAGDNFVHRLLQSKTDGKLVATQTPGDDGEEKIDSMQLEFSYLLTQQLETQREYYEEKLVRLESTLVSQDVQSEAAKERQRADKLEIEVANLKKEKISWEKKVNQLSTKLSTIVEELAEEKQFSKTLQANHLTWQAKYNSLEAKYKERDTEISELKEQVRDLMFFMEAQNTIAKSELKEEIEAGSVTLGDSTGAKSKSKKKKNKN